MKPARGISSCSIKSGNFLDYNGASGQTVAVSHCGVTANRTQYWPRKIAENACKRLDVELNFERSQFYIRAFSKILMATTNYSIYYHATAKKSNITFDKTALLWFLISKSASLKDFITNLQLLYAKITIFIANRNHFYENVKSNIRSKLYRFL